MSGFDPGSGDLPEAEENHEEYLSDDSMPASEEDGDSATSEIQDEDLWEDDDDEEEGHEVDQNGEDAFTHSGPVDAPSDRLKKDVLEIFEDFPWSSSGEDEEEEEGGGSRRKMALTKNSAAFIPTLAQPHEKCSCGNRGYKWVQEHFDYFVKQCRSCVKKCWCLFPNGC